MSIIKIYDRRNKSNFKDNQKKYQYTKKVFSIFKMNIIVIL